MEILQIEQKQTVSWEIKCYIMGHRNECFGRKMWEKNLYHLIHP